MMKWNMDSLILSLRFILRWTNRELPSISGQFVKNLGQEMSRLFSPVFVLSLPISPTSWMIKWSAITKWYSISFSNYWGSLLTPKCKVALGHADAVVKRLMLFTSSNSNWMVPRKKHWHRLIIAAISYLIPSYGYRMVKIGAEFSKEERSRPLVSGRRVRRELMNW